jgi:hypothetical protein
MAASAEASVLFDHASNIYSGLELFLALEGLDLMA